MTRRTPVEQAVERPLMAQAVANAVGATKRQVQLWTDAGVIKCLPETDRQGRGRQRLYPTEELPFAAIAHFLSVYQIPIGRLKFYMDLVRQDVFWNPNATTAEQLRKKFRSDQEFFLIIDPAGTRATTQNFRLSPDSLQGQMRSMTKMSGGIWVNLRKVAEPFVE